MVIWSIFAEIVASYIWLLTRRHGIRGGEQAAQRQGIDKASEEESKQASKQAAQGQGIKGGEQAPQQQGIGGK